jgi:hypothetical protein
MRAEDITVNKWPADVPCDAVKRNPDLQQGHSRGSRVGSEVWRQVCVRYFSASGRYIRQRPSTTSFHPRSRAAYSGEAVHRRSRCNTPHHGGTNAKGSTDQRAGAPSPAWQEAASAGFNMAKSGLHLPRDRREARGDYQSRSAARDHGLAPGQAGPPNGLKVFGCPGWGEGFTYCTTL